MATPSESAADLGLFDAVVNLCKRRGFVFPSAEIYGGIRSTYDYGPLGALMLRNIREAWWRAMIQERDDVVPLDAAILTNPKVWEASGHLATFTDPLVDCRKCKERWRADQIEDTCPNCGSKDLTEARPFNLMFKTFVGPVEDESAVAYLRPETAQGMFVNYANVETTMRRKPPFGIAQIGRAFRNEITPGNFVFRTREFEMMELEFFVPPPTARVGSSTGAKNASRGTSATGSPPTSSASGRTIPRSSPTTPRARQTSSSPSLGAGASSRASPIGPTSTCEPTRSARGPPSSTSTRRPASATCPT